MKTYKTILSITLLAGVISSPLLADENRLDIDSPLAIGAFSESDGSSMEIDILSELEMAETKGEYASLEATFLGFDWYGGGRREAYRSIYTRGSCFNCGFGNVSSQ